MAIRKDNPHRIHRVIWTVRVITPYIADDGGEIMLVGEGGSPKAATRNLVEQAGFLADAADLSALGITEPDA